MHNVSQKVDPDIAANLVCRMWPWTQIRKKERTV